MMMKTRSNHRKVAVRLAWGVGLCAFAGSALALTLGTMALDVTNTFSHIGKFVTAGSYIAGLGFAVGAIAKFKAHKDNPTQITIGQPIGLLGIAVLLLFMPTLLKALGATIFGTAETAGPTGMTIHNT